jgi:hypothetical protein
MFEVGLQSLLFGIISELCSLAVACMLLQFATWNALVRMTIPFGFVILADISIAW